MRELRNIWSLVMLIFCFSLSAADVSYIITPHLDANVSEIKVQLEVTADSEGNTTLVYFDEAWGEQNLYNCLSSIQVLNTSARLKKVPEQNKIFIKSNPSESLLIEYTLRQDFEGDAEISEYYRPIINADYFHLFGHRLFLLPSAVYETNEKLNVRIKWDNVPYTVQHNFGLETDGTYDLTRDELLESVVVGGDFRRHTVEVEGIKLHLLTRGKWKKFKDHQLVEKLADIVNVQRAFWNDYSDDIYTVTLLPLQSTNGDFIGGTGLSRGFASYCSNSKRSSLDQLSSLYYHEIMHHWIGGKIRNKSADGELWFSEGFTEYFAHLLMVEQNDLSQLDFEDLSLRYSHELASSKYSNLCNEDLTLETKDYAKEKIPYLRGFLYASYLDKQLREKSGNTLKLLMLEILKDSKKDKFSNEYFLTLLIKHLGVNSALEFNQFIINGESLDFKRDN